MSDKDIHHRGGEYKHQENKVYMVDAAGRIGWVSYSDTTPAFLTSPKEMPRVGRMDAGR